MAAWVGVASISDGCSPRASPAVSEDESWNSLPDVVESVASEPVAPLSAVEPPSEEPLEAVVLPDEEPEEPHATAGPSERAANANPKNRLDRSHCFFHRGEAYHALMLV